MTSRQIFKRWKIRRGSAVQNLLPQNYHFSCSDWERETHSLEDQGSTSLIKSYQHYSTIIVLAKFVVFIYSGILKILCPNVSLELEIRYGPQSLQSDDPAHQNFFLFYNIETIFIWLWPMEHFSSTKSSKCLDCLCPHPIWTVFWWMKSLPSHRMDVWMSWVLSVHVIQYVLIRLGK